MEKQISKKRIKAMVVRGRGGKVSREDVGNGRRMNFVSWKGLTNKIFERAMLKYLTLEIDEGFVVGFELIVECEEGLSSDVFIRVTVADDGWVVKHKQTFSEALICSDSISFESGFLETLSKTSMIKNIEEWLHGTINKMKEGGVQ